ncbi:hypothetical protein KW805_04245 [Candidatus Pacearchaeota archaeon]|nr:hypothetical protein [Candidatus Pacearchaeota archaeon]
MVFDDIFSRVREARPEKPEEVVVLAIAGYGGSGKSYFIREFSDYLSQRNLEPFKLSTDLYHMHPRSKKKTLMNEFMAQGVDRTEAIKIAYDHDTNLMAQHLALIKDRQNVQASGLYEGDSGEKNAKLDINFENKGNVWVLFEGVYVLDKSIRGFLDQVVFLEASHQTRLERTDKRAQQRVNPYTIDREIFRAMDRANHDWLEPQRRAGDIVIDNNDYTNRKIIS